MIGRRSHDDAQAFEDAWSGSTPRDEHVAALVRLAEDLCAAAVVEPAAPFRDRLRAELMTEAATVLVPMKATPRSTTPSPARSARPVRRRVAGLTAALVASAGAVSLVGSSAGAVPGDLLYPVKRSVESVELQLHRGDASRGSFQLAQASERLAEARELSDKGPAGRLAETFDDFSSQASAGSSNLFSDYSEHGKEQSIREVTEFASAASAQLADLSTDLPDDAGDSFDAATEAVSDLATEASSLCAACTSTDLSSLVAAVTSLAGDTPVERSTRDRSKKDSSSRSDDGSGGSDPAPSAPTTGTPTQKPLVAAPPAPNPTQPPTLGGVTKPLVGALLGDEEQEGLVPGLLGGVTGQN